MNRGTRTVALVLVVVLVISLLASLVLPYLSLM
jgi:competence protein ComGC